MRTIIKKSLQGLLFVPALALVAGFAMPVLHPSDAYAQHDQLSQGTDFSAGAAGGIEAANTGNQSDATVPELITQIVNVLLYIIGAVAVIMIIYGGFKYVTSGGDSSGVTSAKNTILYAVIGLVIAVLAYAIVNFVLVDFLEIS